METLEKTKTLAPEPEGGAETLALQMPANSEDPGFGTPSGGDRTPFAAADLVWGRIKGHNWLPGRICDQSQPSDRGKKPYRSVPVSYFGDGTVSWCNPSQLKPFVENFHQMAGTIQSKGFVVALESALGEIGRCLEVQMVCYCVPAEERNALDKYFSMNPGVSNYSEREFLDLVKNVAVDLSVVDSLDITRLRSRVVAYQRGCSYADPSACHRRKGVKELVDKIDLDVPPSDLLEEREEETVEVPLPLIERSCRSKGWSMDVLIAEMDSDSMDVSDGKKEKYGTRIAENGSEVTGPGRRERKKSKYLSPPYTYLSGGISKLLASDDRLEMKTPRSSRASVTRSLSAIQKYDAEDIWREEDEESSPVLKFDSLSVDEVLSEFLAMAINPLHLKYNRAAKTVTGFFAKHRSSVYSSGAEFVAYQKRAAESVSVNMEIVNREVSDKFEEGEKSEEKRGRRRRRRKDEANGGSKTPVQSGSQSTDQSVIKDRAVGKRKMVKEGADGETLVSSMVNLLTVSGEGNLENKKEKRKAEGNHEAEEHSGDRPLNIVESGTKSKKSNNGKKVFSKKNLKVNGGDKNDSKVANSSQEKKSRGEIPISVMNKIKKALNGQRPKDSSWKVYPAALILNFSQGINLPAREDLISAYTKYGNLIESEVEMLKESNSARVVFMRCTDAEKAFNDKAGPFGPPIASYRLHYLAGNPNYPPIVEPSPPAPTPPLPYIRKSLERMISSLNETSTTSEDNLLGEMQGLLTKVNGMLSRPADGTSN